MCSGISTIDFDLKVVGNVFIVENFKLLSVSVHVHKECMLYFVVEMWHFIFCLPHTYSLNQFRALDKREYYKISLGYFFYYVSVSKTCILTPRLDHLDEGA